MNLIEKVLRKEIERTSAPESLFRIDSTATRLLGELFRLEGFDSFYHQLRNYFLFLFLTSFTFYCYYCFSVLCSFLNHISFLVGIDWLHSALESHVNAVCHKPGNFLIKKKNTRTLFNYSRYCTQQDVIFFFFFFFFKYLEAVEVDPTKLGHKEQREVNLNRLRNSVTQFFEAICSR
jgi:hypothetical protein